MKKILGLCLGCTLGLVFMSVLAADPVDLRGKRGVVNPADLKKDDPPERSLKIKEPPSPEKEKPSGDKPASPPSDEGQKPGPGTDGVKQGAPHRIDRLPGRPVPGR